MSPIASLKSSYRVWLTATLFVGVCTFWFLSQGVVHLGITPSWVREEQRPGLLSSYISGVAPRPTVNFSSLPQNGANETNIDLGAILNGSMPSFTLAEVQERSNVGKLNLDAVKHDKWIVVTSIAPPTDDVKYLAGLKGWKVIVVGDSKTPANWSFPNCIYLSVEKQKQLGLEIVPMIPFRNYGRKMIGYLYAIAHGAQIIYETDDDNRPTDKLQSFVYTDTMNGLMFGGERVFNPYRHFGQSTLWPRGYPLSLVGANSSNEYRLANSWKTPVIQQGAVNGDPDMDAIFRLTRKFTNSKLEVKFDPTGPPAILPEGVFTPYNAQNTFYLKNAFWSFYLPLTTTFRVTDIWRSYWAQRLLWEIDEYLGYFPPNAYQQRNSHSYLNDFIDEDQVYKDTELLMDLLYRWRCPANETFFQCAFRLAVDMANNEFLGEMDVHGMHTWLNDLVRLGYPEPERKALKRLTESGSGGLPGDKLNPLDKLRKQTLKKGNYTHFVPTEQIPPTINRQGLTKTIPALDQIEKMFGVCQNTESLKVPTIGETAKVKEHFKDILLIIVFNHPFYKNIPILEALYRPIFPNLAYCGEKAELFHKDLKNSLSNDKPTFLEMKGFGGGYFGHKCAARAMSMRLNVTGYFVVGDDQIITLWNFYSFNKDHIWVDKQVSKIQINQTQSTWNWWGGPMGRKVYAPAYEELHNWTRGPPPPEVISPERFVATLASNIGPYPWGCYMVSDVYYIPARLAGSARFYFDFFDEYKVFLELVVPTVLRGLDDCKTFELISGLNLWGQSHERRWRQFNTKIGYIHPMKLSNLKNKETFCSVYFPLLQTHGNRTVSFDKKSK